jgi:hypothetical protein
MAKKITGRQREMLEGFQLRVPRSRRDAHRMLKFITEGNGTQGDTELDRVHIAQQYEQRWLDRHFRHPQHGTVQVIRLVPLEGDDVRKMAGKAKHPFAALVKVGDSDVMEICRLSALY